MGSEKARGRKRDEETKRLREREGDEVKEERERLRVALCSPCLRGKKEEKLGSENETKRLREREGDEVKEERKKLRDLCVSVVKIRRKNGRSHFLNVVKHLIEFKIIKDND